MIEAGLGPTAKAGVTGACQANRKPVVLSSNHRFFRGELLNFGGGGEEWSKNTVHEKFNVSNIV